MKSRFVGLGFGILLIVAAFALVVWQGANTGGVALAQGSGTATPTAVATGTSGGTTPAPTTVPSQQTTPAQSIGDAFWALLAGKLNLSADDVKSKAVQARQEMIDQAVKDGRITQAQGDALKAEINSNNIIAPIPLPGAGQLPGRGGRYGFPGGVFGKGGFGGGAFGHGMGLQALEAVAKALKLEPQALIQQLSQGKTLADIATAQSVDQATVKQTIIDAYKAQIDQLLSYGLISQVQADEMKAQLTPDKIDLTRGWLGGWDMMEGGRRMPGMMGPGGLMPFGNRNQRNNTVPQGNQQTQ